MFVLVSWHRFVRPVLACALPAGGRWTTAGVGCLHAASGSMQLRERHHEMLVNVMRADLLRCGHNWSRRAMPQGSDLAGLLTVLHAPLHAVAWLAAASAAPKQSTSSSTAAAAPSYERGAILMLLQLRASAVHQENKARWCCSRPYVAAVKLQSTCWGLPVMCSFVLTGRGRHQRTSSGVSMVPSSLLGRPVA
jgi:hypothetical protein